MAEKTMESAVKLRAITKKFPGVIANENVDLDIKRGEVLALLGENGAGKTTLMNVAAGLYNPEAGQIFVEGEQVHFSSPRDAIEHGIGMVHQHFMLVQSLTVAENIVLGLKPKGLKLDLESVAQELKTLSDRYRISVDPYAYIWQLSVGEQQRVEIMRLLYRGAEVLILDEPTAVLTPQEAAEMASVLRQMAESGKAIIIITHKLDEVMAFSDRVVVLRGGKNVAEVMTKGTSRQDLARLMVGREVFFKLEKDKPAQGEVALEVGDLQVLNDKALPALHGISFMIRLGEIMGVAGVSGNGQRELAEAITGLRQSTGGYIKVNGVEVTNCNPRQAIETGISHIPGDRLGMGLVGNLPVFDNLAMKAYRHPPLARGLMLDNKGLVGFARKLIESFQIITPGPETPARLLSGGNQQRMVLAREITASQGVLIAVHPTRGLDVGATESVRKTLIDQRSEGAAVLLISEDLDELIQVSDQIMVLYEGEIMGILPADEAQPETLGLMMAGERHSHNTASKELAS